MRELRGFVELFDKNDVNTIVEVPYLFEAFMEYASPELKAYYNELTKEV